MIQFYKKDVHVRSLRFAEMGNRGIIKMKNIKNRQNKTAQYTEQTNWNRKGKTAKSTTNDQILLYSGSSNRWNLAG